jgi:hypothetical protein
MSLTNAQPRFAVETESGTVFCYLTSAHYPPEGEVELPDGTWDMALVKAAILAGTSVTPALVKAQVNKDPVDNTDKVKKADDDFKKQQEAGGGKRTSTQRG